MHEMASWTVNRLQFILSKSKKRLKGEKLQRSDSFAAKKVKKHNVRVYIL